MKNLFQFNKGSLKYQNENYLKNHYMLCQKMNAVLMKEEIRTGVSGFQYLEDTKKSLITKIVLQSGKGIYSKRTRG